MKLVRFSRLFGLAVVPVLFFGLFFAVQSDTYKDEMQNPVAPNTVAPGDRGPGWHSIIPGDGDTTKIEYRNIMFMDGGERSFGPATSGAASTELL